MTDLKMQVWKLLAQRLDGLPVAIRRKSRLPPTYYVLCTPCPLTTGNKIDVNVAGENLLARGLIWRGPKR